MYRWLLRSALTLLAVGFCVAWLNPYHGIANAEGGTRHAVDPCIAEMLSWDFNDQIKLSNGVGFTEADTPDSYRGLNGWELPQRELSERELMAGALWVLPDGSSKTWTDTLVFVQGYYNQHGTTPSTGADMYYSSANTKLIGEAQKLPRLDLFKRVCPGINPVTGRFYNTFSSKEWSPGGFFTERVNDVVEYNGAKLWPQTNKDLWHTMIFGEQPGTVLVDTYTYTRGGQ